MEINNDYVSNNIDAEILESGRATASELFALKLENKLTLAISKIASMARNKKKLKTIKKYFYV